MLRLVRKRHGESLQGQARQRAQGRWIGGISRVSDRPNRADYRYRNEATTVFLGTGLFALGGWIGLIASAITGDFAISFTILVVLLTVAAALAFYGLRQQRYGFTVLAAAVMLGGIGLSRLTE
ncbi:hypothetical protein AMK09_25305 [Streptomyces sp. CB02488]|nr:hypothetical protein AMK09_25305 [Streptomyces sp. CB02488]